MADRRHPEAPADKQPDYAKQNGHWQHIGDLAKSVTKRAIICGYQHRVLSMNQAQALIDRLRLWEA